jgi:hypothetical protein
MIQGGSQSFNASFSPSFSLCLWLIGLYELVQSTLENGLSSSILTDFQRIGIYFVSY